MIRVKAEIDTDVIQALKETYRAAPRTLLTVVNRSILPRSQDRIDAKLNTEPGPVVHPFVFASPESQRWYFANKVPKQRGKKRGKYPRSGKILAWKILLRPFNGESFELEAFNPREEATFVFGPRQVLGHRNTGWPNAQDFMAQENERLQDELIDAWWSVTEPGKGTRFV